MKKISIIFVIVAAFAQSANAGVIEQACRDSGREAANRALCGCIQDVADLTLTKSDQRIASRFFRDPHQAQEVRQSSRSRDEDFWKRYKNFGETAEVYCAF